MKISPLLLTDSENDARLEGAELIDTVTDTADWKIGFGPVVYFRLHTMGLQRLDDAAKLNVAAHALIGANQCAIANARRKSGNSAALAGTNDHGSGQPQCAKYS